MFTKGFHQISWFFNPFIKTTVAKLNIERIQKMQHITRLIGALLLRSEPRSSRSTTELRCLAGVSLSQEL
jgi:hypothetical protein